MDQNDVGPLAGERLKSGMHRSLPRGPAVCRRRVLQFADRITEDARIVRIQHRLHGKNLWMTAERRHRPENHALAADRPILLWSPRAGTKPTSGCDKDSCSPFNFRHWTKLLLIQS